MQSRTRDRTRVSYALGTALLAHAIAGAALWPVAPRSPGGPRTPSSQREIDLELLLPVTDQVVPPSSPAPTELPPSNDAHAPHARALPREGAREPHVGNPVDSPAAPEEHAPDDGSWTFSPVASHSARGAGPFAGRTLEGVVRAGVGATLAQERAEAPAGRVIVPPYTEREIALGLAPGGALATVARDLVRRSRVPDVSHAQLQFDTDARGVVVAFRVLDVTSGRAEWDEVAQAVMAASHERPPLHVPTGARGLCITLYAASDLRTVDGATERDLLDRATHLPLLRVTTARVTDVEVF